MAADEPETGPARSHGLRRARPSAVPRALDDERPVRPGVWTARVITLLPEAFPGVLGLSLTGRALAEGRWALETIPLRAFGIGRHRNVDDTPAGGGAGMVLRPDVAGAALDAALAGAPEGMARICLSPRGRRFDQARARALAAGPGAVFLCARFEGVDQRVIDEYGLEELSIGDYVLTGGELAAQVVIDATVRLLPGVLGNAASLEEESFASGLLEHPQYTRPVEWRGRRIPEVLLSGHHERIRRWRREQAEALTRARRPDLLAAAQRSEDEAPTEPDGT